MNLPQPRIIELGETVSTNADAMRLAKDGEALPLWVVADRQTGGRGRSGRTWESIPGNLFASLAIECRAPLKQAGQLALVAGVALFDAVQLTATLAPGVPLRLKWPNDILAGTGKAGGILVESISSAGNGAFFAVMGFGLNVAAAPPALGDAAVALREAVLAGSSAPDARSILRALVGTTAQALALWDEGRGFSAIRAAFEARTLPIGAPLSINTLDGRVSGTYAGVSETGALRMTVAGTITDFTYGDVALVTDADKDRPA